MHLNNALVRKQLLKAEHESAIAVNAIAHDYEKGKATFGEYHHATNVRMAIVEACYAAGITDEEITGL